MNSVKQYTILLGILLFSILSKNVLAKDISDFPRSIDLKESGINQRRDLSLPFSRLVINFFDFSSTLTAAEYSNRATLPLNVAYLSTEKNDKRKESLTRFSRAVNDLLTIHESDNLQNILRDSLTGQAIEYKTEWMPHALPFSAKYVDAETLQGVDFLYDEHTIVREIDFSSKNGSKFSLSGSYKGNVEFKDNKVFVDNNNIRYCIAFSCSVANFTLNEKCWALNISGNLPDKKLIVSVSFADKGETIEKLVSRAEQPIANNDASAKLKTREKYWDDLLARVPRPHNFELSEVTRDGVTVEELRQAYYKAWVFTIQNVLPADKTVYPYPQICTGKPSLWDEGETRAPFSAAWESFLGIQFYSFIDPDVSWKAFKGLMSLVDNDGMLGGESLPSRKAQTALILYRQTNDVESLNEVYPAIKRYLNWRMKITHWVYGDMKPSEDLKDAEFAFSLLVDLERMTEIAGILGKKEDQAEWQKQHQEFSAKCLSWFWETPDSEPVQYYDLSTKERKQGNTVWVTTGLYVDGLLNDDYKQSMIRLFDKDYSPSARFAGFNQPKYPDISYTVYGLLKHGFNKRALGVVEANLRDIVKTHSSFAEEYVGDKLLPAGVRPSLFGSSTIIDFVWLINGFKYDRGIPELALFNISDKERGVSNIKLNGDCYQLKIEEENNILWGKSSLEPKHIQPENLTRLNLNAK